MSQQTIPSNYQFLNQQEISLTVHNANGQTVIAPSGTQRTQTKMSQESFLLHDVLDIVADTVL